MKRAIVLLALCSGCIDFQRALDAYCAQGNCAEADGGVDAGAPRCDDGVRNGAEADTDCGGSCSSKCGVDKGCAVRVQPGKRGLGVDLRGPGYDDLRLYVNQFPVGSAAFANANGSWHHVRIEIRGRDRCMVAIDGKVVLDHRLRPPAPSRGGIALSAYTGGIGSCTVYYDNVVVTPLDRNN